MDMFSYKIVYYIVLCYLCSFCLIYYCYFDYALFPVQLGDKSSTDSQQQIINLFILVLISISLKSLEGVVHITFSYTVSTKCFSLDSQDKMELIYYVYHIFAWELRHKSISFMCIHLFVVGESYFLLKSFLISFFCIFTRFH